MLKENEVYSIDQLKNLFGGNMQSSMPIKNGKVTHCKFNPKINPKFPNEVWIEIGPIRKKGANYLANTNTKIPVFEKLKANKWKYIGKASFVKKSTPSYLKCINTKPPRDEVQIVLEIRF